MSKIIIKLTDRQKVDYIINNLLGTRKHIDEVLPEGMLYTEIDIGYLEFIYNIVAPCKRCGIWRNANHFDDHATCCVKLKLIAFNGHLID